MLGSSPNWLRAAAVSFMFSVCPGSLASAWHGSGLPTSAPSELYVSFTDCLETPSVLALERVSLSGSITSTRRGSRCVLQCTLACLLWPKTLWWGSHMITFASWPHILTFRNFSTKNFGSTLLKTDLDLHKVAKTMDFTHLFRECRDFNYCPPPLQVI